MTGISWADESWNPVVGCTPVSTGCAHCYAAKTALRLDRCGVPQYRGLARKDLVGRPAWSGAVRCLPDALYVPYRWARPRHVFLGSMSDVFHEAVPHAFLDRIWTVMEDCDHCFLVLTKRPRRMAAYLRTRYRERGKLCPHIHLGTSIESTGQLHRLDELATLPHGAPIWLSLEPLLDDLAGVDEATGHVGGLAGRAQDVFGPRISSGGAEIAGFVDWIVCGGESGPGARPVEASWVRRLRDLCRACEVPFHFKQWGAAGPGRELDGRTHDDRPAFDVTWWPDGVDCRTCGAPALRHHRCRDCLRRLLAVTAA